MAVNFPASLDNFTNPSSNSSVANPSHSQQHADANDAIEALEAKVGITGSSVVTSHDYKITQLESLVTSAVAGAKSIYQDVRNQSGSSFSIATPVYISGSEGASGKMLISAASNASEATSSKTMGLTTSAISNNSNGQVISEGLLEGIDTTGAADGDPVWLGVNGAKIYGLANKPSAPAHLVFLGIVIRGGSATTGSIYVKIQNGFELQEIHNVEISSLVNGNILAYDSTTQTWKNTNTLQSTSSTTPLVVKGTSSPSANIFEVQNSSGYPMVFVDAYGALKAQASGMYVNSGYASGTGLVVRGYTSQTANLQEWQNSAGTVLANVDASGNIYTSSTTIWAGYNRAANGAALYNFTTVAGATYAQAAITRESGFNGNLVIGQQGTGAVLVQNGSASAIGLIVKGTASQTANLQEWQDSAGTVLASVDKDGYLQTPRLVITNGGNIIDSAGTTPYFGFGSNQIAIYTRNAAYKGLVIQGSASQTANLQEWQDSAGTMIARISNIGGLYVNSNISQNSSGRTFLGGTADYSAFLNVSIPTASRQGIVVRANASQTANLQEWQSSSGTALVNISSSGVLNTNANINLIGVSAGGLNRTIDYGNSYGAAALYLYNAGANARWGWGLNAGEMQFFATNDSVNNHFSWNRGGDFQAVGTNEIMRLTVGTGATSTLNLNTGGTAATGLVIKGAASQTADLQQWQDSSSTVLASINANGNLRGFAGLYGTNSAGTANYPLFVTNSVASTTVAVIKGATSQTASLQEWQDSAGTTLANISSTGRINAPQFGSVQSGKTYVNTGTSADNNSWTFVTNSASNKGIVIVGSSSQTANLQEWQNSAGIVVANIGVSSASFMGTSGSSIYNVGINAPANSNVMLTVGTTGWSQFNSSSQTAGIYTRHVNTGTGDMVGIYSQPVAGNSHAGIWSISAAVRSAGGASAVITNAYNFYAYSPTMSSGTITNLYGLFINTQKATNVTNAYGIYQAGVDDLNIINGRTTINAGSTTYVPLTIKAIASQTANLTEWQNSTGTVLSYVDASGSFTVPSLTVSGDFTVNGTTTNINTTNLVVEDKNITIADVSTPTDTTADGAGITIKGATDKTFNWVQSSGRFVSSEPVQSSAFIGTSNIYTPQLGSTVIGSATLNTNADTGGILINTAGASNKGLIVKGAASQTADLQQWQDTSGTVLGSVVQTDSNNMVLRLPQIQGKSGAYPWISFGSSITNTANQATDKPLVVKAAPSQTGNLTEWQNSSGNIVARLYPYNTDSDYILYLNGSGNGAGSYSSLVIGGRWIRNEQRTAISKFGVNTGEWHMATNPDTSAIAITDNQVGVFGNTTNLTTFTVRSAASQTAALQEWQNSAGTAVAYITTAGSIRAPYLSDLAGTGSFIQMLQGGSVIVNTRSTTNVGLVVFGVTSQTANLQEWQNSAGTVLSSIDASGSFTSVSQPIQVAGSTYGFSKLITADIGATSYWKIATLPSSTLGTYDQINIDAMLGGWASTGKTRYEIMLGNRDAFAYKYTKFGDGLTQARIQSYVEADGSVSVYLYSENTFTTLSYNITLSTAGVANGATIYKNPTASTTAPTGTKVFDTGEPATYIPLINMNNAGLLSAKNGAFTSTSTSAVTLTVQAAASQTANIQEWKNNAGTTYLNVTNAGAMISNGGVTIASNPTINAYGAAMKIASGVNSYPMLILQAAASQTADIQQWQNSAGTILTRIGSDGAIYRGATTIDSYGAIYTTETIAIGANNTQRFASGGMTIINRELASSIIFGVKGIASQTGDLTQWRNSSDTVLAKVDANGNFSAISKSFDIPHPTKENMRLRYASLEGNEHGVYVRGITKDKIIELPDYWLNLVNENSITVHLTPIGKPSKIYVKKIEGNKVYLGGRLKEAAYIIYAERKDIDKLVVEY